MVTVAIISEYNPFHKGHEFQIRKIREEFGEDTAIIAIMSGNYTQRGDIAISDKGTRARCALIGGVNLVLEIPFPFSSSSAEFFAKSGVKIADSLGIVDYLSFGSESGDIKALELATDIIESENYKNAFLEISKNKGLGYPETCEEAYRAVSHDESLSFTPNNILALEYIKALRDFSSSIKPHTIKREGAGYNETNVTREVFQSAMSIRECFSKSDFKAYEYIPASSVDIYEALAESGDFPTDISKISASLISYFRLNPPISQSEKIHDAEGGLYNRLYNASFEANDISTLLTLTETKKYTKARLRRAMLNVYFGVTSSEIRALPHYTQILAMDKVGMRLLKSVRKSDDFEILTKPSAFLHFNDTQRAQKLLSDKADSIFELTKPIPKSGKSSLTFTPYIKK